MQEFRHAFLQIIENNFLYVDLYPSGNILMWILFKTFSMRITKKGLRLLFLSTLYG